MIEFKINATGFLSADRVQTERYAQSLSDFHEASQQRLILPILCAERARARPATTLVEGVGTLMEANATTLADALLIVQSHVDPNAAAIDAHGFDYSPYRPTPNIVEAAQALYAGREIADIGRGDAADAELQAAAASLQEIAADAEASRAKVVCFVTGAPGAGKTLLGLDLALKSRSGTRPAALLSSMPAERCFVPVCFL